VKILFSFRDNTWTIYKSNQNEIKLISEKSKNIITFEGIYVGRGGGGNYHLQKALI